MLCLDAGAPIAGPRNRGGGQGCLLFLVALTRQARAWLCVLRYFSPHLGLIRLNEPFNSLGPCWKASPSRRRGVIPEANACCGLFGAERLYRRQGAVFVGWVQRRPQCTAAFRGKGRASRGLSLRLFLGWVPRGSRGASAESMLGNRNVRAQGM